MNLNEFRAKLNRAPLQEPNVRLLMMTLNKSPLRSQHNLLDRLMDVADDDEKVVIEAMRSWDPDDVRKFANEYVKQRLPLQDYYEVYLFGSEDERIEPEPEPQPEPERRRTIVIPSPGGQRQPMIRGVDSIPVRNIDGSDMDKNYGEMLKTCLGFFRVIPWIKDRIKAVYIQPIQNLDESFYNVKDVHKYVEGDWDFEEELFFRPKERYYTMQCMGQNKVQDGDVTSLVWKRVEYKFKVGFLTESGLFVVQNEEILGAESNFLETWVGDYDKKKHSLLNNSPTEIDKSLVKSLFLSTLVETVGTEVELTYTGHVMDQIFDPLIQDSATTNDFFDKVVNVVAFIRPNVKLVSSTLFVKRLTQLYYNFSIIGFLTEKEKLSEIYDDNRVPQSTIDYVSEKIYHQKEKLKHDLIENLVTYDLIPKRKPLQPTMYKGRKPEEMVIGLPPWKAACANVDDVKDIDDEHLIFYKDVDKVYCFHINNLLDRFNVMDNTNPYTQNLFDPNFVRRILSIYKPQQVVRKEPSYEPQQEELVEGPLIFLIEEELIRLENSLLNEVPEFFVNDLVKKCKACHKDVNINDGIETILKNKLVKFCSIKCFEAKEW